MVQSRIPDKIVDWEVFNQVLAMDDTEDETRFSLSLFKGFCDQAIETFASIENNLKREKDLEELGKLGHFLKGSSSTLGLQRIAWLCERIQTYGQRGQGRDISDDQYLKLIAGTLDSAREEFTAAKGVLGEFYKTQF